MNKQRKYIVICFVLFLFTLFLATSTLHAKKDAKKEDPLDFEYAVFPTSVYVGTEVGLSVCLINKGGSGELIYDNIENFDYVTISIPRGPDANDLIEEGLISFSCSSDTEWTCYLDDSGNDVLLTIHPNSTVAITEGQIICFNINAVDVNDKMGLVFLDVDQQFDKDRAKKSKVKTIGISKMESSLPYFVETDPVFSESVSSCIVGEDITNWRAAFGWGDHSLIGLNHYLW